MTSSAGSSGLIFLGSPPMRFMASRMAARSTTAGTPVKSCSSTRAGVKAISLSGLAFGVPVGQGRDVGGADGLAVLGAEEVFQEDLERERQAGRVGVFLGDGVEAVDGVVAVADAERRPALERVDHDAAPCNGTRAKPSLCKGIVRRRGRDAKGASGEDSRHCGSARRERRAYKQKPGEPG